MFLSSPYTEAIDARACSRSTADTFSDDFKVGSNYFIFGGTATPGLDFEGDELLTVVDLTSDEGFAETYYYVIFVLDASYFVAGRGAWA